MLDNRERKIIFDRFGLDGGKPKTLEEIGKKFGVTRERIRQLQNIALVKLRRALAKREKPVVRRDPIQFPKPVSPDPTRTRLRVAKAYCLLYRPKLLNASVVLSPNRSSGEASKKRLPDLNHSVSSYHDHGRSFIRFADLLNLHRMQKGARARPNRNTS